jgi:hypothetical protein
VAGIRPRHRASVSEDQPMLELRLRSGEIVAFYGRILEVFAPSGIGARLHVAQIEAAGTVKANGAAIVTFRGSRARLHFTREEAPAYARLLAAIHQAQRADAALELGSTG